MAIDKSNKDVLLADAFGAVAPAESEPEEESSGNETMEMSFGTGVAKRTILVTQGITVNKFVESSR